MCAGVSSRFHPGRVPGLWVAVLALGMFAPPRPAVAAVTVHSRSGQFIVHSAAPTQPSLARVGPPGTNRVITLYPDPLAVSCERIKAAVLAELGLPDRWRGKVHVTIDARAPADLFPLATALPFADGWQLSLRLPRELEPPVLIRGVVHAVLLEWVLRNPGPYPPEIPVWLVEALTGQVLTRVGPDPVAAPNPVTGKYGDALGQLVATLRERGLADEDRRLLNLVRARGLLTFEELSLPTPERLTGAAGEHYRACSQFLFVALRQLPQGPARLAAFLARLPRYLNWQTAFLDVYAPVFPRLLEVEKWWALVGQRLGAAPGPTASTARLGAAWLEDLLGVEIRVRPTPNAPPQRQTLTFQQILTDWDYPRQRALFTQRLQALVHLTRAAPGDAAVLARAYAQTLENYLAARARLAYQPALPGITGRQLSLLVQSTRHQLDALDARRRTFFGPPAAPAPEAPAGENAPAAPAEKVDRPPPGPEAAGVQPPYDLPESD